MAMTTLDFLRLLYGTEPPGYMALWMRQTKQTTWLQAADLVQIADTAVKLAEAGDVYFGIGLHGEARGKSSRGTANGVIALPGVWLDVDVAGEAHKASDLPPDIEAARSYLTDFPLRPTVVVHSGHGLQAWWLFGELWRFDDKSEHDRAADLVRRFQETMQAKAWVYGWSIDSTPDLARVLRLPGTWNRKLEPVRVQVLEAEPGRRYTPADFEPYLQAGPRRRDREKRTAAHPIKDLIPEGQRNATLTSLAGTMRRRGMSEEAIRAALLTENQRCNPPLPPEEVAAIAASVARYPPSATTTTPGTQHFHRTDLGNAGRLVALHGQDLRYCHTSGTWYVWDGRHWAEDVTGEAMRRAKATALTIYEEAAATQDDDERKAIVHHAIKSEAESKLCSMLALAQSEPGIPVRREELDADAWLLNVANGTLDLRTGALRPHRREDMQTRLLPIEYRPDAKAPTWDAFLSRVMDGNDELMSFLQRAAGYCLTGDVSEHVLFLCYGTGANGKSVFLRALLDLLGPYGKQAEPELLLARRNEAHPTGLADLCGTRLAVTIETDEGRRFNESLVKWLTGGDIIKARFMRQDFFEFLPTHKLWIATNHKPVVRGTDDAIWRRLRLIPFAVTIPPGERDKRLSEKLRAELPGILAWAVRGCMEWQRCGLQEPAAVITATAAYRQEMDLLAAFLGECCVVNPLAKVQGKALFAVYEAWCVQTGESALTYRQFNARLKERGFTNDKGTKGWFVWHGIGLSEHARVEQLNSTPPPQKWSNSTQAKQASEASLGSGVEQGGVVSPITALNRGGSRGNRENCSTHSTYSTPALAEVAAAKDADGEEAGEL